MKYLCLIFLDEKRYDVMPESEQDACVKEHLAYDDELRKSGYLIVTEALQSVKTATIVRVRDGKVSVTDGPSIKARDLNDAIRVASKIPSAHMGSIEVRPIMELNPQ